MRKYSKIIIFILIILVIAIDIGYSYLEQSLSINQKVTIDASSLHSKMYLTDTNWDGDADVGEIITIGTERFYVISNDGTNVKALAEWNLLVGNQYDGSTTTALANPTGLQDSTAKGWHYASGTTTTEYPSIGTVAFSSSSYWAGTDGETIDLTNSANLINSYLTSYKTSLTNLGGIIKDIGLITKDELISLGCDASTCSCMSTGAPSWVYQTSYWTSSAYYTNYVWYINNVNWFIGGDFSENSVLGVRPVITINSSKLKIDQTNADLLSFIARAKAGNVTSDDLGKTFSINMGTYGTHTLRVANTTTPSECSTTGFSQSACGVVLEFADIITTHTMNDTATNVGGWPASSMRTFVNTDIYNALPEALRNNIIATIVISGHGSSDTANFTSTDKLYLLDVKEVYGSTFTSTNNTANDLERQLDYYESSGVTISSTNRVPVKYYYGGYGVWYLRGAYSKNSNLFYFIDDEGFMNTSFGNDSGCVSPAFRVT